MDREIEFKGKTIDGSWVYGLLSISKGMMGTPEKGCYISNDAGMPWAYQIRPETVCQYTRLKDKNCKKIYKYDRIKIVFVEDCPYEFSPSEGDEFESEITYLNGSYIVDLGDMWNLSDIWDYADVEIIGNKFDSPELLEGK